MKKDLVSIIVAIYNGKDFLNKCVDSIINQTYDNLEIILVDDGSTDGSGEMCDNYLRKDNRIKVIHKSNGGVSSARNAAIEKSTGDYICIMDQDDWLEPFYVKYLLSLIKKYNVDLSMVPQVFFTTDNQTFYNEKRSENESELLSGEEVSCLMLNGLIEIGPWNKMVSRKLINDNKIRFNTELFGGDGYLFSIESFMSSKNVAVGYKGIYHYRIDNYMSEMSKFRIRTAFSSFKAVNIIKEKYYNISKEMDSSLDFAEWSAYYVFLIKMIASGVEKEYHNEYVSWRKKLKREIIVLLKAKIPLLRKIKYFLIVNFTSLFICFKRIKNKIIRNKKDRDYSKSK